MFPLRDTVPYRHPPIVTLLLIFGNSVIFMFELLLPQAAREQAFNLFGVIPARYAHPDWAALVGLPADNYWPFLTSMFLHGNWVHVFSNMWTLWIFGDNVEDRMGPVRFLTFYILCGFAAGAVHCLAMPNSTVPAVGASGAIAGVMGAYFVLFPYSQVIVVVPLLFLPYFVAVPAVTYLGFWVLTQLVTGTLALAAPHAVGGIAWWAHAGGFGAGLALHILFIRRGPDYRPPFRDEYAMDGPWQPSGHWREQ